MDVSDTTFGYIVSHGSYADQVDPRYGYNIDNTLTLTGFNSLEVHLHIESLSMEGYDTGDCASDDRLTVTGVNVAICGDDPGSFKINLGVADKAIAFKFITNGFDAGLGFWLRFDSECHTFNT